MLALACGWCTGCDRPAAEAERVARERAALEQEKAQLAGDRTAAERAALMDERARLEAERAALGEDQAKLAARSNSDRETRLATERAQRLAAEKRASDAEARASEAAQTVVEQSVEFFYDALDPHGDWLRVDPYGYCWQPRQARDPRWRPYTDGGWVYTDYGWTWRSNEPFGWAAYHYGRWARLPRRGWIWVPNTEWGPAWVSWRHSDEHIGWAPLPPDAWSASGFSAAVDAYFDIGPGLYSFVRVTDFGEPTYVGRVVEPEQNVTIVNQTVNVTNVTYKTVKNKVTIVNQGPDIAVINERSRTPVRRMALERETARGGGGQAAKVEGNTMRVVAPELRSKGARGEAKPRQVKEEVPGAEVDRGWTEAKEDAPKIRAAARKHAQEAEAAERAGARGRSDRSAEERPRAVEPPGRQGGNAGRPERRGAEREKAVEERPVNPAATTRRPPGIDPPARNLEGGPAATGSPPGSTPLPAPTQTDRTPTEKPLRPTNATPAPGKAPLKPFRDPAAPSAEPAPPATPVEDEAAAALRKTREKQRQDEP